MDLKNRPLISTARLLAYEAHAGLMLEGISGDIRPQTVHLQEVADLVWASGGSDEEIAAAWLHDSVEDTPLKNEDVAMHCGDTVAHYVHALTDYDEWLPLPLLERKTLQSKRVAEEDEHVRRIKLCDQTSNVRSIGNDQPTTMTLEECRDYAEGARRIAEVCKGISPMLDELFDKAYQYAAAKYGKVV
jgi:guanosine-3',5'-bis(diphosphate) 3'-pyrophosphohydrolase